VTEDDVAQRRWFAIVGARLAGVAGAVLGLILIGRAPDTLTKVIGIALVMSALVMIAIVPRNLVRRWRTPPGEAER
jgi:uncharacterized membrane protein YfcA